MIQWLQRLYTIYLPKAFVGQKNPFFTYKFSRLRGIRTDSHIRRYLIILFGTAILTALIFAGGRYLLYIALYQSGSITPYLLRDGLVFILILATITFSLAGDVFTLIVTITQTDFGRRDAHWDLITLTGIRPHHVIEAEESIAQIRAWRLVAWEVAFRLFLIAFVLIETLGSEFAYRLASIRPHSPSLTSIFAVGMTLTTLGFWYVFEPYWRMRMMVGIALRLSARTHTGVGIVLACAYALISTRFIQGIVLFLSVLLTYVVSIPIGFIVSGFSRGATSGFFNILIGGFFALFGLVLLVLTFEIYNNQRVYYLQDASRTLFTRRDEDESA